MEEWGNAGAGAGAGDQLRVRRLPLPRRKKRESRRRCYGSNRNNDASQTAWHAQQEREAQDACCRRYGLAQVVLDISTASIKPAAPPCPSDHLDEARASMSSLLLAFHVATIEGEDGGYREHGARRQIPRVSGPYPIGASVSVRADAPILAHVVQRVRDLRPSRRP